MRKAEIPGSEWRKRKQVYRVGGDKLVLQRRSRVSEMWEEQRAPSHRGPKSRAATLSHPSSSSLVGVCVGGWVSWPLYCFLTTVRATRPWPRACACASVVSCKHPHCWRLMICPSWVEKSGLRALRRRRGRISDGESQEALTRWKVQQNVSLLVTQFQFWRDDSI